MADLNFDQLKEQKGGQDQYVHPDFYNMDEFLTEEHKMIRDAVRDWVKREISPIIEACCETNTFPQADITAQLVPETLQGLKVGESSVRTLEAVLNLHGEDNDIQIDVSITRVSVDKIQVVSRTPIIIRADDFLLDAGLEKLREIANLPSITPEVPVTFSLVFTQ